MLTKLRNMMKNQKGFTLVELMVVIAVIGVLAAIAVPKFMGSTEAAKVAKVQADLRTIGSAISLHEAQVGSSPDSLAVLKPTYIAEIPKPPTDLGASTPTEYKFDKATDTTSATASITISGITGSNSKANGTYKSDGTFTATVVKP